MALLKIKIGRTALQHIREKGLSPSDIRIMPGAAGGPKWIALHGLDEYLMKEWFTDSALPLHLVGSSAGAWRMACHAAPDPQQTLARFLKAYVEQRYEVKPSPSEVSHNMRHIASEIVGSEGSSFITQSARQLYILASKTKKSLTSATRLKLNFGSLFLKNLISREWMHTGLERVIFTNSTRQDFIKPDSFETSYVRLTPQNLLSAIRSSGTIPFIMNAVDDIQEVQGQLWDGALIDYHLGLNYKPEGLILFPHFTDEIIPGWFDKKTRRRYTGESMDRMIMISPTQKFIKSLPDAKLPDQDDFTTYLNDNDKRIRHWYEVADRSKALAAELDACWRNDRWLELAEPMP